LNAIPQQLKNRSGHVGVPDDVVLNSNQFIFGKTRVLIEGTVAIRDPPFGIRFRDNQIAFLHDDFLVKWGDAHGCDVKDKIEPFNFHLQAHPQT
jgi:23S rRNA G2445 N2-methylase RlmL